MVASKAAANTCPGDVASTNDLDNHFIIVTATNIFGPRKKHNDWFDNESTLVTEQMLHTWQ